MHVHEPVPQSPGQSQALALQPPPTYLHPEQRMSKIIRNRPGTESHKLSQSQEVIDHTRMRSQSQIPDTDTRNTEQDLALESRQGFEIHCSTKDNISNK